jgi:hypothetical protein
MIRERYKEGEKSKAICDTCSKVVDTTFRFANITVDGETFSDILQGFCDVCGASVSLPHQGAVQISKLRDLRKK